jgi:hypothetical protein
VEEIKQKSSIYESLEKGKKGKRADQLYFLPNSLEDSLRVPKIIWEENGGNPVTILDIANKPHYSPNSSRFTQLLRSSSRYGLTEGSWQKDFSKTISITSQGPSLVAPTPSHNVNFLENCFGYEKIPPN